MKSFAMQRLSQKLLFWNRCGLGSVGEGANGREAKQYRVPYH